ncbi:MAG: hypothetical protein AAGC86_04270 [Pseudomonadota bacterium]
MFDDPHAESLLQTAAPGRWLMACEPVTGTALPGGGRRSYVPGARFKVRGVVAGAIACADDGLRHVAFSLEALAGLEMAPADV